jgi:imidazolonepropionase-like amidohydrolase
VLVRGNAIAAIGPGAAASASATVIDGGGRTLMPGLIDAHWPP